MYKKKNLLIFVIFLGFFLGFSFSIHTDFPLIDTSVNSNQSNIKNVNLVDQKELLGSASGENYNNIQQIFNDKLSKYNTLGYFPQIYESSLQATYYALYVLDALGKLDTINQTAITEYIISYYNTSSHIFMDKYACRYLDIDSNYIYYPFSTLLEVNCYAILSLGILNQLSLIPAQDSIDFILSCYHPVSHAFIGQPYDTCPSGNLKIPTMDNTYYAIITLGKLNANLGALKDEITLFINGLQIPDYGFANDMDSNFRSLGGIMLEPNLLSAYYSIKSLELFGYEDSIDTVNFHQYLQTLYDVQNYIFQICSHHTPDKDNIVASALGVQLSDLTPFNSVYFLDSTNRDGVINFILSNRNSMGNWDSSTLYEYHELIDTFQIIRGLKETGTLSQLTAFEENEIANALSNYFSVDGYALLSPDYVSVEQYYNVINSFYHYDRISDLDLNGIYEILRDTCLYDSWFDTKYFYACTNMPTEALDTGKLFITGGGFHTYPIEYFAMGKREYLKESNRPADHKVTYMALDILKKIFKLDDFEQDCDLIAMLNDVVNCQFLESGYSNFGAFLPSHIQSLWPPSYQNSEIIFEHSYYAIKTLELLVNYLGLGEVRDLPFNKGALYNYIVNHIVETNSILYLDPQYTDSPEIILQNTFYMIELLQILNLYDLDNQKIKNYILQNLNYENLKVIYYSFKISEILNLGIEFDIELTRNLVEALYSEDLQEYYQTSEFRNINQDVFPWVCDMAINDEYQIECNYEPVVYLGGVNTILASFSNIILSKFDPQFSARFESNEVGNLILEKQFDNTYQVSFLVPEDPSCYPEVDGFLKIYQNTRLLEELYINFQTKYDINKDKEILKDNITSTVNFEYNISYKFSTGTQAALNTKVLAEIHEEDSETKIENFTCEDFVDYSRFTLELTYPKDVNCTFCVILVNEYDPQGISLDNLTIYDILEKPPPEPPADPPPEPPDEPDPPADDSNLDWLLIVLIIGALIFFSIAIKVGVNKFKKWEKERSKDSDELFEANMQDRILVKDLESNDKSDKVFFNNDEKTTETPDEGQLKISNDLEKSNFDSLISVNNYNPQQKTFTKIKNFYDFILPIIKSNKKAIFWVMITITVFVTMWFYGRYVFSYLLYAGIGLIVLGIVVLFSSRKIASRLVVAGGICLGLSIFIDFLLELKKYLEFFWWIFW